MGIRFVNTVKPTMYKKSKKDLHHTQVQWSLEFKTPQFNNFLHFKTSHQ